MKFLKTCIFCFVFLHVSFAWSFYSAENRFRSGLKAEMGKKNVLKAMELYRKAAEKKHPDAANRLAVLLEERGQISEAVDWHKKVVKWGEWETRGAFSSMPPKPSELERGANPKALVFAPLPHPNPSMWCLFNDIVFQVSSPEVASAFALARLYRTNYMNGDVTHEVNIKRSDFWYNQAFRMNGSAALIGAFLADLFGEHEEAIKWFERGRKQSWYRSFAYYRKGKSHEVLKEVSEAIESYKKATNIKSGTRKDRRFAIYAALRLSQLYNQGIPEAGIPADDVLSQSFAAKAVQIGEAFGKDAVHLISEETWSHYWIEELEVGDLRDMSRLKWKGVLSIKGQRNLQQQAYAHQWAYLKDEGGYADFKIALFLYKIALLNGEITPAKYHAVVMAMQLKRALAEQSACEIAWETQQVFVKVQGKSI